MAVSQFEVVRNLFRDRPQYLPALTVIENRYPGRVFADDATHPKRAVVWALGRWAYIEGDLVRDDMNSALQDLIGNIIVPDSCDMGINWFELYAPDSRDWMDLLDASLRVFDASRHFETTYAWNVERYKHFRAGYSIPHDLKLETRNAPILSEKIAAAPATASHFRSFTAISCEAIADGQPVSICGSNGFSLGSRFMIDVVTPDANLRGRGFATAAGVGLLDYCIEEGLDPLWETTETNVPSQRLAARLGFVAAESYPVYGITF
ncbi:GNAT family N-acetyltransferase [bacterium]|nr:GNAT family N-acetyltransferase [bacterium]